MNDELRKEVRLLKSFDGISYKQFAEMLNIKVNSFYSWLKGNYDFSAEKSNALWGIIQDLKGK